MGSREDYKAKIHLWGAAFCLGVVAILGQITLLRESLVFVGGNEIALGVTLGIWTLAVGLGSIAAGYWLKPNNSAFATSLAILPAVYVVSLYLIWSARGWMGIGFGEMVGVFRAIPYLLVSLAPLPLVGGIAFSLAADGRSRGEAVGVYVAEGIGSAVAGLAFALVLGTLLTPLKLTYILAGGAFVGAGLLAIGGAKPGRIAAIAACCAVIVAIAFFTLKYDDIRAGWFEKRVFSGYEVIKLGQTRYGAVAVLGREGQTAIFVNGQLIASYPDKESAEEAIHFPLAAHPRPERVALLGGGFNGEVEEISKHPTVKEVSYVQLDRGLFEISESLRSDEEGFTRAGLTVEYSDPRAWVGRQIRTGESYDVVIVQAPEPLSAAVNRYYTVDFFAQVKRILTKGGVLGFNTLSAENYYSAEMEEYLRSVASTCDEVFVDKVVLPTGGITFICSDEPIEGYYGSYYDDVFGVRELDTQFYRGAFIISDYSEDAATVSREIGISSRPEGEGSVRMVTTRPGNIKDILTSDRIDDLNETLAEPGTINRDIKPTSYYFANVLRSGRAGDTGKPFLEVARRLRLWHVVVAVALIVGLWFIVKKRNAVWAGRAVSFAVFAQGFAEISLQILIILGFSSVYGAAYNALALVIGAFMAGLCGGAVWAVLRDIRDPRQSITDILGVAIAASFAVVLAIFAFGRWAGILPEALGYAIFLVISAGTGFLGGAQFPLAVRLTERAGVKNTAGRLYGFDLLGSALGAAVLATIIVPVLGLAQGALVIVTVLASAMIVMSTTGSKVVTNE
ncbi:MAG: hypothetical protein GY771_04630 [bacterium]|nr:hypothetical protein [bacterium]